VIRLCLYLGIEPVFIPPAQPRYNGSVENFNGWFQPRCSDITSSAWPT